MSDNIQEAAEQLSINDFVYHTLLEVWTKLLAPAADNASDPVTISWALRLVNLYPFLAFEQMTQVRDAYFSKIEEMKRILAFEIETDDECLLRTTQEEDAEDNAHHYKNLLMNWQLALMSWEDEWNCESPEAVPQLVALAEIQKMFFGPQALTAHLDNIGFQFTEEDQAELVAILEEHQRVGAGVTSE